MSAFTKEVTLGSPLSGFLASKVGALISFSHGADHPHDWQNVWSVFLSIQIYSIIVHIIMKFVV